MTPLVVLVGPPGSGKSTVGRLVAERRGVAFRDTDADVEAEASLSVADIFLEHGEEHFRALERRVVLAALAGHDGVLALGGGAVLDPDTRARLRDHLVVYLDVGLEDALRRVGMSRDRPLLLGNPRARFSALLKERLPLYSEVARKVVTTSGRSAEEVADDVLAVLDG